MNRKLEFTKAADGQLYPVFCYGEAGCYNSKKPIEIEIKEYDGKRAVYATAYEEVTQQKNNCFEAQASIETAYGSLFKAVDLYELKEEEILISRKISVLRAGTKEIGFSSSFSVEDSDPEPMGEYVFFIPGMWYAKNDVVAEKAFGSRKNDHDYYARATRMALPYVQWYHPGKKQYLALKHLSPVPDTGFREFEAGWLVDDSFRYASLGIRNRENVQLRYLFPGSEGERNYIDEKEGWARRSHPVRETAEHVCSFSLRAGRAECAADAMRDAWRYYYEKDKPVHIPADVHQVYEDGIALLDVYCQEYNHAMGIPFWATVPEGTVCDISFQMGFVGQQTMCAYQMMRYGYAHNNKEMIRKAEAVIDFWVHNSTKDSVVPRVWYNAFPDTFKMDYPTYTRTVADGMEGILACAVFKERKNEPVGEWMEFCESYAGWLLENQNEDGSWYRAYDEKGQPVHKGKFNTTNVIRFLVNLYWQTGKEEYKDAALRAGDYCLEAITEPICYVGGTADNDNTIDKEAGMIAFYAYLSLYEMDRQEKHLQAACRAADFCETWTYSWNYPVKPFKGNAVFDKVNITGLSLIATGHSHADVMMGYMPVEYYRLWLYTGDRHYLEFCRFLNGNTKQTTDWSRSLGHVYPGLVEESGELALQFHNGLGRWLPWCTIALIESLTRLEELFGEMDVEKLLAGEKTIEKQKFFIEKDYQPGVLSSWMAPIL